MRKVAVILCSVVLAFSLGACDMSALGDFRPRPGGLIMEPEEGSPEYKMGWKDGCNSGISVYGTDYLKMFYGLEQNPELRPHPEYSKAWKDAFHYCRHYTGAYLRDGFFAQGPGDKGPLGDMREYRPFAQEGFTFSPLFKGLNTTPKWPDE